MFVSVCLVDFKQLNAIELSFLKMEGSLVKSEGVGLVTPPTMWSLSNSGFVG